MMNLVASRWSRSLIGLALLLASSAVVFGQKKPGPKPPSDPPPPPPIQFNLKLFPTTETGTTLTMTGINGMNVAGDAVGHYTPYDGSSPTAARVYLAGTVWDANDFLTPTEQDSWFIQRVFDINNSFQIAAGAQYVGASGDGLVQGAKYIGLLDMALGTFTPMLESTLGGTVAGVSIYAMNDSGTICGHVTPGSTFTFKAFMMSPVDAEPTYLFPDLTGLDVVHSYALDINNSGQIVGRLDGLGYRYTPGEPLLIVGPIDEGRKIRDINGPVSINNSGVFAGYAEGTGPAYYAYRYTDGIGMVKLATTSATAQAINEGGDVIYRYSNFTPYLYMSAQNTHVNLFTTGVVQGDSADVTRWRNNYPYLEIMNDSRVITGRFNDPARVAFILTPVP